jgi:hypothetical protein
LHRVRLTAEIKVSKEGVTAIFSFETEEHDNILRLYGEFSWKGVSWTQNKGEIRGKTRANTNGVAEIVKN